MRWKIFLKIFFDKTWVIPMLLVILTLFFLYTNFQVSLLNKQLAGAVIPDLVYTGKTGESGNINYFLYRDVNELSKTVTGITGKEMRIYGVTARSLLYMNNPDISIHYMLLGVNKNFFHTELRNYLKAGRLPDEGKKEAVIGSYAAEYYHFKTGDRICFVDDCSVGISLTARQAELQDPGYTVCGILDDNVDYFKADFIIIKEEFENAHGIKIEENMLLAFFNSPAAINAYRELNKAEPDLYNKYQIGTLKAFYSMKYDNNRSIVLIVLFIAVISSLFLVMLLLYLLKGVSKKIGLLKALGISDAYLMQTIITGMICFILLSLIAADILIFLVMLLLNYNASRFIGFKVELYTAGWMVYGISALLGILLILIISVIIKIIGSKISPREAMLKNS